MLISTSSQNGGYSCNGTELFIINQMKAEGKSPNSVESLICNTFLRGDIYIQFRPLCSQTSSASS